MGMLAHLFHLRILAVFIAMSAAYAYSAVSDVTPDDFCCYDPVLSVDQQSHIRASLWGGWVSGNEGVKSGLSVLVFGGGYGRVNGKSYVPVLSPLPLLAYYDATEWELLPTGIDILALFLAPVNGLRLQAGGERFFLFADHRFELLAPHWVVTETIEMGMTWLLVEGAFYQRYSNDDNLRDIGMRLGLTWHFMEKRW